MSDVTLDVVAKAIGAPDSVVQWATHISDWGEIYGGKTPRVQIARSRDRARRSMGIASRVCQDWAAYMWTENATVSSPEEVEQTFLELWFDDDFAARFADFLEAQTFARGWGALEVNIEGLVFSESGSVNVPASDPRIHIDTVPANGFIPLKWDRGEVIEAACLSRIGDVLHVREHRATSLGRMVVNRAFRVTGTSMSPIELDDTIAPIITMPSSPALFVPIRPGIANSLDCTVPFGVSVLEGCKNQIVACDTWFDNFIEDVDLGGKAVFISEDMLAIDEETNKRIPPQWSGQRLFVDFKDPSAGGALEGTEMGMREYNPDLRVEDNTRGISTSLDLLSQAAGFGPGRYEYREGGVKTAKEVVSESSDLYRHRKRHMHSVLAGVEHIARAALYCARHFAGAPVDEDREITVTTDDSVIEDDTTRIERGAKEFERGLISHKKFLIDYKRMDEDAAVKELEEIAAERAAVPPLF